MAEQTALIIGAGPAGLTAAYELLERTSIKPVVFEMTADIGGIAKTVNHDGNRIDIGGHRFFSKSDRVMDWWMQFLPLQAVAGDNGELAIGHRNGDRAVNPSADGADPPADGADPSADGADSAADGADPDKTDLVMLVRQRLSRIFFLRKFFDYPISLNLNTIGNLGLVRIAKIGCSIARVKVAPIRPERSLEDFLINRFGRELYLTFFKDYTEKVWGVPCDRISPEWGAQRIKGLSITKAIAHAAGNVLRRGGNGGNDGIAQKSTETSLIDRFLYPKLGPGQLWEHVADLVRQRGGDVHLHHEAVRLLHDEARISGIEVCDHATGQRRTYNGDYVFSTMPVQQLVGAMADVPPDVQEVADGLMYRDFITVGLLLRKMKTHDGRPGGSNAAAGGTSGPGDNGRHIIPDNWVYIQERDVRVGRLQVFNNWSPYMVRDPDTVWLGLEYFCQEGDDLWRMDDADLARFATAELAKIDLIDPADVLDSVVIRMPKTYPAYFGSYDRFDTIRRYVDGFENLFLVGRNGMHRYNNQDHSMLTAMVAVENIINGVGTKENIWNVNAEQEYHEEKKS